MTLEEFEMLEEDDIIYFEKVTEKGERVIIKKTDRYFLAKHPTRDYKLDVRLFDEDIKFILENYTIGFMKVKDTRLARKMYPNAEVLNNGLLKIKKEI